MRPPKPPRGFTLAELLIALAILGVIATFAIPKILASQNEAKKKAVFREVIGALSDINYQGFLNNSVTSANNGDYIFTRLNAVKLCPTDVDGEGCWTQPTTENWILSTGGVVLANGATLGGWANGPHWCGSDISTVLIDWNGKEGPNLSGDDQLSVTVNYGKTVDCWGRSKPGQVIWHEGSADWPAFKNLWENVIFAS